MPCVTKTRSCEPEIKSFIISSISVLIFEKCSFCVQRVNSARASSKRNHEEWTGQGMATACQESCSSNAIAFGNINDIDSAVAINKKSKLTYRVLDETGVESNVRYLAKIRNIEGKSSEVGCGISSTTGSSSTKDES